MFTVLSPIFELPTPCTHWLAPSLPALKARFPEKPRIDTGRAVAVTFQSPFVAFRDTPSWSVSIAGKDPLYRRPVTATLPKLPVSRLPSSKVRLPSTAPWTDALRPLAVRAPLKSIEPFGAGRVLSKPIVTHGPVVGAPAGPAPAGQPVPLIAVPGTRLIGPEPPVKVNFLTVPPSVVTEPATGTAVPNTSAFAFALSEPAGVADMVGSAATLSKAKSFRTTPGASVHALPVLVARNFNPSAMVAFASIEASMRGPPFGSEKPPENLVRKPVLRDASRSNEV